MSTGTSMPEITTITQSDGQETGPDLRSWLATLESADQLRRITVPVDWDEEIGAITRANLSLGGPALLFENILGHENTRCTKLLTSALGSRRQVQLMLGLPEGTSDSDVVRHLREAFKNPIPPRVVDSGPVKENIIEGNDIDLYELPVPKWHGGDGGRYIDTFCGVVTQDKVTGRDNVGLYRGQIVDRDKIAKLLVPSQGWGGHMEEYKPEPMPVAVVYGWHDVLPFCAGSPFPKNICEWDMMGLCSVARSTWWPAIRCRYTCRRPQKLSSKVLSIPIRRRLLSRGRSRSIRASLAARRRRRSCGSPGLPIATIRCYVAPWKGYDRDCSTKTASPISRARRSPGMCWTIWESAVSPICG